MAKEIGFPPPDDPKNLKKLKSKLLSSSAVMPELQPGTTAPSRPKSRVEAPRPANENAMAEVGAGAPEATHAETKAKLSGLIGELHTIGKAAFADDGHWQDWKGRVEAYQPKPPPADPNDPNIMLHEGVEQVRADTAQQFEGIRERSLADFDEKVGAALDAMPGQEGAHLRRSTYPYADALDPAAARRAADRANTMGEETSVPDISVRPADERSSSTESERVAEAVTNNKIRAQQFENNKRQFAARQAAEAEEAAIGPAERAIRTAARYGAIPPAAINAAYGKEGAPSRFGKAVQWVKNTGVAVGKSLQEMGVGVRDDLFTAGKALLNPGELLRQSLTGVDRAGRYVEFFLNANNSTDAKLAKLKIDSVALVEGYNKLPQYRKLEVTAALIIGSAATGAVGLGGASFALAKAMYGQRILAASGFGVNRSKDAVVAERSNIVKYGYAAAAGVLYGAGTMVAGRYVMEHLKDTLGSWLGHSPTPAPSEAVKVNIPKPPYLDSARLVAEAKAPLTFENNGIGPAPEHLVAAPAEATTPVTAPLHAAEVPVHHEPIHHHAAHGAELSIDAREQLETKFLNDWQLEHPGAMPSTEQINDYIAHNTPSAAPVAPEAVAPAAPAAPVEAAPAVPHAPVGEDALKAQLRARLGIDQASPAAEQVPAPPPHVEAPAPAPAPATGAPTPLEHLQSFKPAEVAPSAPTPSTLPPLENMGNIGAHPVPHPLETTPSSAESLHGPAVETTPPPAPEISTGHAAPFENAAHVPIDPTQGHVFEDAQHSAYAYGNDFKARFASAQQYARAHRGTTVWVQAEKPVFYKGAWRPWVFPVKTNFLGWLQATIPAGPPDPAQIGGINPDSFVKQLDGR
jgi:orotate phosphoribosyltransferase